MLVVKRNIKESSDGLPVNFIKVNLVEVEPVFFFFDISFSRRLVSLLGSFLVYVFNGGEDYMILWPLLAPMKSMRILGLSYIIITVVSITEVLQSPGDILPLRFKNGSLESVVYWQVLHCGFYKLRIWEVGNLQKKLNDSNLEELRYLRIKEVSVGGLQLHIMGSL